MKKQKRKKISFHFDSLPCSFVSLATNSTTHQRVIRKYLNFKMPLHDKQKINRKKKKKKKVIAQTFHCECMKAVSLVSNK